MRELSIESRSNQYGNIFGNWQISKKLGTGSNGKTAVYQLSRKDEDWVEHCALKVVTLIEERGSLDEFSPDRQQAYHAAKSQRIHDAKQEVRLMESLRGNTNIVGYLDYRPQEWAEDAGFGCDMLIRMEFLQDLRSEIRRDRAFTTEEVIKIGMDICTALDLCHQKDILHRDIKPENIFFNKDGNYKLGDFGVSKILDACPGSSASTSIGTYEYWPAEQMSGHYDKRADLYSLGLVLYELCNANRLPFAKTAYLTGTEVPTRLSGVPLEPPVGATPALSRVILKACQFYPEDRYASAKEMMEALRRVDANEAGPEVEIIHVDKADPYATLYAGDQPSGSNAGQHRVEEQRRAEEQRRVEEQRRTEEQHRAAGKTASGSYFHRPTHEDNGPPVYTTGGRPKIEPKTSTSGHFIHNPDL